MKLFVELEYGYRQFEWDIDISKEELIKNWYKLLPNNIQWTVPGTTPRGTAKEIRFTRVDQFINNHIHVHDYDDSFLRLDGRSYFYPSDNKSTKREEDL